MRVRVLLGTGCVLCLGAAACSAILDLQPPPDERAADAGSSRDATMPGTDTGTMGGDSAAGDGQEADSADTGMPGPPCNPLDAALPDGETDAETVFSHLAQVVVDDAGDFAWQFYDTSGLGPKAANYAGGTFDGRYVYFVPAGGSIFTRYDTTMPFSKAAFSTFDLSTLGAQAASFSGAVFDGRYLYLVPHTGPANSYPGLLVRFDTTAAFAPGAAWSVFDTSTLPVPDGGATARGFGGGVFDGRYVYLVPDHEAKAVSRAARYDTLGTDGGTTTADGGDGGPPVFGSAALWQTFDTTAQDPSALGFVGGVYDGRYVYLVPAANNGATNSGASGIISRFDTTKSGGFTSSSSWLSNDLTAEVDPTRAVDFFGGAFDGQYVWLVPFNRNLAVRYNTLGPGFNSAGSWKSFDLNTYVRVPDAGTLTFAGAGFDGRFVYLVPANSGVVIRHDTLPGGCWESIDIARFSSGAGNGFVGAIYDGRWLYLAPKQTVIARFDTKSATWIPNLPAFRGSFY